MDVKDNSNFPQVMEGHIGSELVQTVNARDLHTYLEVGKDFSTWIKDRISQYDFAESVDYVKFQDVRSPKSGSTKSRPQTVTEYSISIDMAKELAMVERNEKGKQVRQYFIESERRAKNAVDPVAVLNNPAAMRGLLLTYSEKVIELQSVVEEMRPAVEALEQIAEAHGSFTRTEAAKHLGVAPQMLCRWMTTNGWTYRRPNSKDDIAYQSKITAGYLEHKVSTGLRPDGTEWISTQVRVTPKGLTILAKAFPKTARAA